MNLENTLYYTFSTISQTLATGLGLLAAVILFRLDKLERKLDESIDSTIKMWSDSKAADLRARDLLKEMIDHWKNVPHKESRLLVSQVNTIEKILEDIPRIKAELKRTCQATCGIIGLSVTFIVLTPILHSTPAMGWMMLAFGIIFSSFALAKFYMLIKTIL